MAGDVVESHDVMYHGSRRLIKGALTPHRGRNPKGGEATNRFGVYATPDFHTAIVYTIGARRTTFTKPKMSMILYSNDAIHIRMLNCCWDRKPGYVYVVDARPFEKIHDFEYVSMEAAPILETQEISVELVDGLIAEGKLVLSQDSLPSSSVKRFALGCLDRLVALLASVSNMVLKFKNSF